MKTINLRDFYRSLYDHDSFCEVPDEVAELLIMYKRREEAYQRRKYRNKAHYSLDCGDGIENEAIYFVPSAEEVFFRYAEQIELFKALQSLTDKQLRRLYWHSVLKMSYAEIAQIEKVTKSTIRESINDAKHNLSKKLKFF